MSSLKLDPASLKRDSVIAAVICVVLIGALHLWVRASGARSSVVIFFAAGLPPAILLSIATAIDPRVFISLAKQDSGVSWAVRLTAVSITLAGMALGFLLASHYAGNPLLDLF